MEAILAAVIGAILGAFATHFFGIHFQRRKERRETRCDLVGILAAFTNEYLAALVEIYSARLAASSKKVDQAVQNRLANVIRLEGKAKDLEVRLWRYFHEVPVRAAYHKLVNRFNKVRELLGEETIRSQPTIENAFEWIQEQMIETALLTSETAGIKLKSKETFVFVGFRKVTEEDRRIFSFEDIPPPWLVQDSEKRRN